MGVFPGHTPDTTVPNTTTIITINNMTTSSNEYKVKVKDAFETIDVHISHLATIGDLKRVVCSQRGIPACYQDYYYRGQEVTNDQDLQEIGIEDDSIVFMNVNYLFLQMTHPYHIRDHISGLLLRNPIKCSDNFTYDQGSLTRWSASHNGYKFPSPMKGVFINLTGVNEGVQSELKTYINTLEMSNEVYGMLSLKSLGRSHTILGPVRHIVGGPRHIPRIVCVGSTDSGMGYVVERLNLFPSHVQQINSYLLPVQIRFRRGPESNPVLRVIRLQREQMPLGDDEDDDIYENTCSAWLSRSQVPLERVTPVITRAMNLFQAEGATNIDRYIVIDVVDPTLPDVTLVVYPGLSTPSINPVLVGMLRKDLERFGDRSTYLHVTRATEHTEDGPYSIIAEYDGGAFLNRAVGVVTHLDCADPARTQELVDLALSGEGAQRDHAFAGGTFLLMNKPAATDPVGFEAIYLRNERERAFFMEKGWLDLNADMQAVVGGDALLQQLHILYFYQLEVSWFGHVMCKMQEHLKYLRDANIALGLPAVTYAPTEAQLTPLLDNITTVVVAAIRARLPSMLRTFEEWCVEQIKPELNDIIAPKVVPVLEVNRHIQQVCLDIVAVFDVYRDRIVNFWLGEMDTLLQHDESEFKLRRFPCVISSLKNVVREKLLQFHNMLLVRFQNTYDANELIDKSLCIIEADRRVVCEMPTVQLSFKIHAETVAFSMCESRRIFAETICDVSVIKDTLKTCTIVENCRLERFDNWHEQRLLQVASSHLLDLAYEFDSVHCVLHPQRMVSLYHVKTGTFLAVNTGKCVPLTYPEFSITSNSDQLEGHSAARFMATSCDGDIAFYHQETRKYLCFEGDAVRLYNIPTREDGSPTDSDLLPLLRFEVDFVTHHSESNRSPNACRAVNLYYAANNTYLTVTTTGEDGDAEVGVSSEATEDTVFVVVANPME